MRYSLEFLRDTYSNFDHILASIKLPSRWGGNDNVILLVGILNDTGSTLQTVFDNDLVLLRYNPQTYQGNMGQLYVQTANGVAGRQWVLVEMQLRKPDGTPAASDWFVESSVITPFGPTQTRLSGSELRSHLYFATA